TGLVREFWVVVASDAFVEFLASLDASTSGYNALTEPQRFFRFFPDLEYETAAFFYRFQEVGGHLPSIQRQHTFYGLINAWASAFTGIPEERDGRMPDEARAMAMVLRDMDQINYSLSNASNANLSMIANTVKNLWNVSEAGFIWDNSNYFTKLGQYLFYSNGDNMLPSPSSTAVTQILNLAHMLARSDVSPTATMPGANLTYVQKASSFVTDYMDTASSGVAATIQITKLNDTPGARSEQARRMVFETISYRSGALIPKEDELQLLGLGYLYGDLDGLVTQPLFNPGLVANIIGNYRVYFPNLAGYLSSSGFTPEYFLAYRTYSTLHPDKKPAEVIAAVNGASSEYRTLLNQLDGNYAVFKDRVRIEEIIGDYNIITSPTNISWRPTEVALYRRDNLPPLYVTYSGSNLEFYWKETGTQLPPQDYGQFTLLIDVYPPLGSSVREKVATLEVPVYIHGTAWTNKRDTLKAALAATYPLNYNDLVAVRTPVKPDVLPPELRGGQEAYLLRAADQVQQNREIAEGWLDYFTWYHGDIVLAKIIESLDDPGDLSEFWPKLRTMAYDIRARDSIIEDYKLWKFFDIYLQRWLNIESGGRLLFDDFLWHPGDFLDLGPLDPREYIIGLSKMMINPGDAYNFDTNRKGFVTDYPLESHRTGLFFSNIYAFRSVNNVRNVGEMIERYLVLANRGTTAVTPLELASTWLNNLLNDRTIFETYTYKDAGIPLPGSVGWNVYVPERSSISANLWEHFRINSDELLPLFTLPLKTTPDLRVTVMPGIVLIGSTVEYTDTGSSVLKNITFNDRFGRPLLNVIYNLEKRHDYQGLAINTPWLRKDFRSSWLDKGSVFVFDFPRGTSSSSPINTFFYYPLHFWEDTHSYASSNRIELGRNPFYDNNTLLGWNDELQYLLLEVLSLHDTFGYSRPLRLLQQEMGGMLQPHDGLNWNLTADDETLVPTQSEMQANLRRLWEGRNLFDKWWGDVYLRSQGTRAQQLYTYQNRSATGVARFIPAVASISSYVYDNPRTYAAPTAVQDAYYINGNYRLQSIPIPSNLNYERGDWLVDPRSASFKLLNPPDRYFSTEWTGGGDQNYIGFSLIPRRDTRYDSLGSRYDLPRVDLLEQIFYRHGWYGVMGYLSEQREATSLEAMVYAAVNSNLGGLTNSVYGSWTEWTLQEWQDRIWKISDAQLSLVSTAESSMAGLANWEWEKLIYLMDDPGYLKEFFVNYLREKTIDFTAYDLQVIASPGQPLELRADRATTFEALNNAQRMLDGKPHPLTPGVPLFNPRDALWLLNVTARAGDYVYDGPAGEENYRTVADNLKLLAFGGASTVLNDTDTLALDPNDAYVDELIRQALR
ncbi:MAG: hypothetical protein FWE76_06700, partial [Symbiobacteriaceae bacterium]|nr:hypothetical protein [Symbiobacteriaceae bacterium]